MSRQNDTMVSIFFYLMPVVLLCSGVQSAKAASFNCSKASNLIESLICKDASLSKKDSQMASLYKKAVKDLPRSMQNDLRGEQRNWLDERDECVKWTPGQDKSELNLRG